MRYGIEWSTKFHPPTVPAWVTIYKGTYKAEYTDKHMGNSIPYFESYKEAEEYIAHRGWRKEDGWVIRLMPKEPESVKIDSDCVIAAKPVNEAEPQEDVSSMKVYVVTVVKTVPGVDGKPDVETTVVDPKLFATNDTPQDIKENVKTDYIRKNKEDQTPGSQISVILNPLTNA